MKYDAFKFYQILDESSVIFQYSTQKVIINLIWISVYIFLFVKIYFCASFRPKDSPKLNLL